MTMTLALNRFEENRSRWSSASTTNCLPRHRAVVEKGAGVEVDTYSNAAALADSGAPAGAATCRLRHRFDGVPVDSFLASLRSRGTTARRCAGRHRSPMSRSLRPQGGAAAYLARSAGVERLAAAIRDLIAGELAGCTRAPGAERSRKIARPTARRRASRPARARPALQAIALELDISESTAKGYARNLFAKLGAHSRAEAVYIARNRGLLHPAPTCRSSRAGPSSPPGASSDCPA